MGRRGNHLQFVPFDVVEEAFVCTHSLRLDRFKQVLPIVGEGTHQEVLLITATIQQIMQQSLTKHDLAD